MKQESDLKILKTVEQGIQDTTAEVAQEILDKANVIDLLYFAEHKDELAYWVQHQIKEKLLKKYPFSELNEFILSTRKVLYDHKDETLKDKLELQEDIGDVLDKHKQHDHVDHKIVYYE